LGRALTCGVGGETVKPSSGIDLQAEHEVLLENGERDAELLAAARAAPIGEARRAVRAVS